MLQCELNQFIGSENYYKHFLGYHYTDGVKYLAEKAGAYWLLDAIFSHIHTNVILREEEDFLSWRLKSDGLGGCILTGDDGNNNILVTQIIPFTTFPFSEVDDDFKLFFTDSILLLPSEY